MIADIIEHLKHTTLDGEILFMTHAALMLLPYIHRRQDWHLILDEIPQAESVCGGFSVADSHRRITDRFSVDADEVSFADNRYVRSMPKDCEVLEEMARNQDCRSKRNGIAIWRCDLV